MTEKLLKLENVLEIFPVSKSTWYRGIKRGLYPAQIYLSAGCVAWKASEIYALADNLQGKF
jgi:prophage regulatory protein